MELNRKQFDVLENMATAKGPFTQRKLEELTGYSLGTVNRVVKELTDLGFVDNGAITSAGLEALEPYRARRAVFIAAGFGSRMVVTGDPSQVDLPMLPGPSRGQSGLVQALQILANVKGIAFHHFQKADVVRHPLVGAIVHAYDEAEARR